MRVFLPTFVCHYKYFDKTFLELFLDIHNHKGIIQKYNLVCIVVDRAKRQCGNKTELVFSGSKLCASLHCYPYGVND